MNKSEIKLKLHSLIENINDEMVLLNFYNAFSSFESDAYSDSYQLTDKQANRLAESVVQYKTGEILDDSEVRKQILSWLEK